MPFTQEELAYIERLDAAADVALLQQQLPSLRVESLRTLQVQIPPFQCSAVLPVIKVAVITGITNAALPVCLPLDLPLDCCNSCFVMISVTKRPLCYLFYLDAVLLTIPLIKFTALITLCIHSAAQVLLQASLTLPISSFACLLPPKLQARQQIVLLQTSHPPASLTACRSCHASITRCCPWSRRWPLHC